MKTKKLLLFVLLPLSVLVIVAIIILGIYTDRIVDPYVRSLLEVTKPMDHTIEYKKIRVNLFKRIIFVHEVKMFPDSSIKDDKLKMEISVGNIRLTGFRIMQMVVNKHLMINEFLVEDPEVRLILPDIAGKAIRERKLEKRAEEGSPLLTQLQLDRIVFSGGSFQLIRNDVILAKSADINFILESISLVQNSNEEPIGYSYGDIMMRLTGIELHSETGLYDMKLDGFSFTKNDSTIVLSGFRMIPKYDKPEFTTKLEFQNDRFDLNIGEINIKNIGIQRFLDDGTLHIPYILIQNLDGDIYRDKNVPFNANHFPLFYNESFLKIPIPVYIDSLAITGSKIIYGELSEEHDVAGTILLEDLNIESYELNNRPYEDSIESVMQLNVRAMVMGEGQLNLELNLPLEGDLQQFSCQGSVGTMILSPLNDMLEPAINMKFNEGKLNRMTFSFKANDDVSKGWMEFLYQDLDVVLMKKDPDKSWGLISDVTNWAALSNNPAPGKEMKIVEIGVERNKNKGIINYVWKTIQSGMIHTILPIKKYQINRKSDEKVKDTDKGMKKKKK